MMHLLIVGFITPEFCNRKAKRQRRKEKSPNFFLSSFFSKQGQPGKSLIFLSAFLSGCGLLLKKKGLFSHPAARKN